MELLRSISNVILDLPFDLPSKLCRLALCRPNEDFRRFSLSFLGQSLPQRSELLLGGLVLLFASNHINTLDVYSKETNVRRAEARPLYLREGSPQVEILT